MNNTKINVIMYSILIVITCGIIVVTGLSTLLFDHVLVDLNKKGWFLFLPMIYAIQLWRWRAKMLVAEKVK